MQPRFILFAIGSICLNLFAADPQITALDSIGALTWTNAFPRGVANIESVSTLPISSENPWQFERTVFTTNTVATTETFPIDEGIRFYRVAALNVSGSYALGYSNLLQSFGTLKTIAGTGVGGTDNVNYWQSSFEGGFGTSAALSRPHNAIADRSGNIYIVDKCSHSVLKLTPDGRIHTVAGTHVAGLNGDGPASGTLLQLKQPNGIYLRDDGTVFILDTGNGRVRQLDTNGMLSTLFVVPGGIAGGRGLWVNDSATEAVFCDGTTLKAWTSSSGVYVLNSSFKDLGNIILDDPDTILATDRGDSTVWKVALHGSTTGSRSLLYGNGQKQTFTDGTSAVTGSLYGVRGIWKFPTGGYLLALHEGSQIIYIDSADIGHIWLNGASGAHAGDGQWFHTAGYKISQPRSVSMDYHGNILVVENDYGYVRQIDFRPKDR